MPSPFHLSPASLPLSCLPLWPCSLFLHRLCSLCTWPLFPAFPPPLCCAPGCAGCLCTSSVSSPLDPVLSSPSCSHLLLPPTSPALAACSCASSAPCDLPLYPKLSHLDMVGRTMWHKWSRPWCSPTVSEELFSFLPSVLAGLPAFHVCPTLSHPLAPSICLMEEGHWRFWGTLTSLPVPGTFLPLLQLWMGDQEKPVLLNQGKSMVNR